MRLDTDSGLCNHSPRSEMRNTAQPGSNLCSDEVRAVVVADIYLSRMEEFETSQEPNGRTREEGSDAAVTPRCDPGQASA
jgi:hypothetical protein